MQLLLLSTPNCFLEEHQILRTLFEAGLTSLHLSKDNAEPVFLERLLTLIPQKFHRYIFVHQYYYLNEEYGLGGVHLDHPETETAQEAFSCTCSDAQLFDSLAEKYEQIVWFPSEGSQAEAPITHPKAAIACDADENEIAKLRKAGCKAAYINNGFWNRFNLHSMSDYKAITDYFHSLQNAAE